MRILAPGSLVQTVLGTACALALATGVAALGAPLPSEPGALDAVSSSPPADASSPQPDPVAVATPAPEILLGDPELAAALSTSTEGLYEEAAPGGGVMVNLQGRFHSVVFATLSPGGVQLSHRVPAGPAFAIGSREVPQVCLPLFTDAGEASHAIP